MLFKRLLTVMIIHFCCLQLAFGEMVARIPAAQEYYMTVDQLKKEMSDFEVAIKGKEKGRSALSRMLMLDETIGIFNQFSEMARAQAQTNSCEHNFEACTDKEKDQKIQEFIAEINGENSCGVRDFEFVEKKEEAAKEVERIPGYFDELVAEIMELEERRKGNTNAFGFQRDGFEQRRLHQENDPRLRELYERGRRMRNEIEKRVSDSSLGKPERKELLETYLNKVVLQMRDLVVIRRAYQEREYSGEFYYNDLLPHRIPNDLYGYNGKFLSPEEGGDYTGIIIGPTPETAPHGLKVEDDGFGSFKISFDRLAVLVQRDILTLLKAPTTENYVRSMKWLTLNMIVSQIQLYTQIKGDRTHVKIPNSCQNHLNGDMPPRIKVNYDQELSEELLQNILSSHGMVYQPTKHVYFEEYYRHNVNNNPLQDGYSGIAPFEEYTNAEAGLGIGRRKKAQVDFDDIRQFDKVFGLKSHQAEAVYRGKELKPTTRTRRYSGRAENQPINFGERAEVKYRGLELLKEVLTPPQDGDAFYVQERESGKVYILDTAANNLSPYMKRMMELVGTVNYEDLIGDDLEAQLKQNLVKIKLPALYGSATWRDWGLRTLAEFADVFKDKKLHSSFETRLTGLLSHSCRMQPTTNYGPGSHKMDAFCQQNVGSSGNKVLANVADILSEYLKEAPYTPGRRIVENQFEPHYDGLSKIWEIIRDHAYNGSIFEEGSALDISLDSSLAVMKFGQMTMSEWDYLHSQMRNRNPWARLRLSYLLALQGLDNKRDSHFPKYNFSDNATGRYARSTQCFYNNADRLRGRFVEAGSLLGLNKPLAPAFANNILSDAEKNHLYRDILDKMDEGVAKLFTSEDASGTPYYKHLTDVSYKTLLSKNSVESLGIYGTLENKTKNEINEVFSSDFGKRSSFFLDLYKARGNVQRQQAMYEQHVKETGITGDAYIKMQFLELENMIKEPIHKDILKKSVVARRAKVEAQLEDFCELGTEDHEAMKTLFYAVSKQQNKLNEMAGLAGTERIGQILEKLEEMSPEEWSETVFGLGAAAFLIGGALLGAACAGATIASGGLAAVGCGPALTAYIAFGTAGLAAQAYTAKTSWERKQRADQNEQSVQALEELGFADKDASYNVSMGWFWPIFEIASLIPFAGLAFKSIGLAGRVAKSGSRALLKGGDFSLSSAMKESDDATARLVLGFQGYRDGVVRVARGARDRIANRVIDSPELYREYHLVVQKVEALRESLRNGLITTKKFFERLSYFKKSFSEKRALIARRTRRARNLSPNKVSDVNLKTAETLSKHFHDNASKFLKLISTYNKPWSPLGHTFKREGMGRLAKAKAIMLKVNRGDINHPVRKWILKFRYEHLSKMHGKLSRIETELKQLVANGQVVTKGGTQTVRTLEDYVLHNIDDLTEAFIKIPMRKRELPYVFLLQGGPHIGARSLPGVGDLADGILMRKLFNARDRLVTRAFEKSAAQELGITLSAKSATFAETFDAFQTSLAKALEEASDEEAALIKQQYEAFQDKIFKNIEMGIELEIGKRGFITRLKDKLLLKDKTLSDIEGFNEAKIKEILFNPNLIGEEKAVKDILWKVLPYEDAMDTKNLPELASAAMKELRDYNTVDDFQKFVNALKIFTLTKVRSPGVVEIL